MSPSLLLALTSELLNGVPLNAAPQAQPESDIAFADVLAEAEANPVSDTPQAVAESSPISPGGIRPMHTGRVVFSDEEKLPDAPEPSALLNDQAIPIPAPVFVPPDTPRKPLELPTFEFQAEAPEAISSNIQTAVSGDPDSDQHAVIAAKMPLASPDAEAADEFVPTPDPPSPHAPMSMSPTPTSPAPAPAPQQIQGPVDAPPVAAVGLKESDKGATPERTTQRSDGAAAPSGEKPAKPMQVALNALVTPEPKDTDGNIATSSEKPLRTVSTDPQAGNDTAGTFDGDAESRPEEVQPHASALRHSSAGHEGFAREVAHVEPSSTTPATPVAKPEASPRVNYVEPKEIPTAASTQLKRVEVRIPDSSANVVVQVQERQGAVQVTVRTNDAQTASDIAGNLPELTQNLNQQGFRADTWTPDRFVDAVREDVASRAAATNTQTSDVSVDIGPADKTHSLQGAADLAQANDADTSDSQRRSDWDSEQQNQRRKKSPQEDFEEYLW